MKGQVNAPDVVENTFQTGNKVLLVSLLLMII